MQFLLIVYILLIFFITYNKLLTLENDHHIQYGLMLVYRKYHYIPKTYKYLYSIYLFVHKKKFNIKTLKMVMMF